MRSIHMCTRINPLSDSKMPTEAPREYSRNLPKSLDLRKRTNIVSVIKVESTEDQGTSVGKILGVDNAQVMEIRAEKNLLSAHSKS